MSDTLTIYETADPNIVNIVSNLPLVLGGGASIGTAVSFDDTLTAMGVDNVQDAIVFLAGLLGYPSSAIPNGAFNFNNPSHSAYLGIL